ncbi:MAG: cadherin-like domain-containing protein, partial [Solirubrobacteraceae bacterium]
NNPLITIAEGATDALPMTRLLVTDAENDGALVFTFVSATHGTLEKKVPPGAFMALAANATFTDQDLAAGNVRFVDSGVDDAQLKVGQNTTASFSWRVQDGDGGFNPSPTTANVSNYTVTPVDDPPSIAWRTSACHQANVAIAANPVVSLSDTDNTNSDYSICVVSIGNGSSIVFMTTTQTIGTTVTVTPTLKNGAAVLGVSSCLPATALSGLTMTSSANQDGGSVTWKLVKSATQVGATNVMSFVKSSPPC